MLRLSPRVVGRSCLLLLLVVFAANSALAQFETATVSGQVVDPSGLSVAKVQIRLVDIDRATTFTETTNNSGLYTFPSVKPGRYRMEVSAVGFRVVNVTGMTVNVQDHLEQNFKLAIGSVSESVTVEAGSTLVDTESAAVSTVVDRQFAENLPMNGRSFQTLIELTPGVVVAASNSADNGQFNINGQRAASNYWMVDGVSANVGIGVNAGNGLGGALGSFSALGGTNGLVSVDAMQEFRIQTSTYAPEFGRTPGGQISIVTRSGTNQFHGTVFDYLRNGALDANNWFADANDLPKPKEHQNDFGGTFSGPLVQGHTFFFFSYEGLRLQLPETTLTTVPDLMARQSPNAVPAMRPYLSAFPLPNANMPDVGPGIAPFNATYSNPASLDAYSLRIDHAISKKWTLFGRYNYSPSEASQRGNNQTSLSTVSPERITTQTATIGTTAVISPAVVDDLHFNYSRTNASSRSYSDNFGGALPLASFPFPSPYTPQSGFLFLDILSLQHGGLVAGQSGKNLQRQFNVVDSLSLQKGRHNIKIGVDFRRLSPLYNPAAYGQDPFFADVPSAEGGNLAFGILLSNLRTTFLFRNLGTYAQDTWRILPRLTLTYGLRWDIDFAPQSLSGPNFAAVTGFNLNNLSSLALSSPGASPYKTTYGNLAPRLGLAYQLFQVKDWRTVLRGGFGVFYDLASSEAGNTIGFGYYPFGSTAFVGGTYPLSPTMASPAPVEPSSVSNPGTLYAFDPRLQLPYTLEWNFNLEEQLGNTQTISASYIGSAGRRLLQTTVVSSPNPTFLQAQLVANAGTSNYNALEVQFRRQLSHGLQALASYTWAHSIDTASAGSSVLASNALVPSATAANRGPSDFDIRNTVSAGMTYGIPTPKGNALARVILGAWSSENFLLVRSAVPVDVTAANFTLPGSFFGDVRPDLVPAQPVYLSASQYPGGKAFNPAAFANPPVDTVTGLPLRQGTLPRNFLRGFGAFQWDCAVHRDFPIHEALKVQFRAEMFNVLNHPNFGPPNNGFGVGGFGVSTQMLGQYLANGSLGSGGFSPLYQIGGPRSIQLALRLQF